MIGHVTVSELMMRQTAGIALDDTSPKAASMTNTALRGLRFLSVINPTTARIAEAKNMTAMIAFISEMSLTCCVFST